MAEYDTPLVVDNGTGVSFRKVRRFLHSRLTLSLSIRIVRQMWLRGIKYVSSQL